MATDNANPAGGEHERDEDDVPGEEQAANDDDDQHHHHQQQQQPQAAEQENLEHRQPNLGDAAPPSPKQRKVLGVFGQTLKPTTTTTAAGENLKAGEQQKIPKVRTRTAYFIFAEDARPKAKAMLEQEAAANNDAETTRISVAHVAKRVGVMWAALSEEEKETYKKKAEEEKKVAIETAIANMAEGVAEEKDDSEKPQTSTAAPTLPISVVKRIVARDPDGKRISGDALTAITFATELILETLATSSSRMAAANGRRNMKMEDVLDAVAAGRGTSLGFQFLHENAGHVRRVAGALATKRAEASADAKKTKAAAAAAAGAGAAAPAATGDAEVAV